MRGEGGVGAHSYYSLEKQLIDVIATVINGGDLDIKIGENDWYLTLVSLFI